MAKMIINRMESFGNAPEGANGKLWVDKFATDPVNPPFGVYERDGMVFTIKTLSVGGRDYKTYYRGYGNAYSDGGILINNFNKSVQPPAGKFLRKYIGFRLVWENLPSFCPVSVIVAGMANGSPQTPPAPKLPAGSGSAYFEIVHCPAKQQVLAYRNGVYYHAWDLSTTYSLDAVIPGNHGENALMREKGNGICDIYWGTQIVSAAADPVELTGPVVITDIPVSDFSGAGWTTIPKEISPLEVLNQPMVLDGTPNYLVSPFDGTPGLVKTDGAVAGEVLAIDPTVYVTRGVSSTAKMRYELLDAKGTVLANRLITPIYDTTGKISKVSAVQPLDPEGNPWTTESIKGLSIRMTAVPESVQS